MSKIGIIDSNNCAYKLWVTIAEGRNGPLTTSMGIPTTVIFGLLKMFNALIKKHQFDKIILCWDVSGSYYRKRIYPEYKATRKKDKDMTPYYNELDTARDYFKQFGVAQAICKGIEADDVIGYLAKKLAVLDNKVIIISDDKDYYQLCDKNIKIYRPIKDEITTYRDVCEEYEIPHVKCTVKIKALTGEKTDNIPGIFRLGDKTALKLFNEHNTWSLKKLVKVCDHKRWGEEVRSTGKQIMLAYKLAKIRTKDKEYDVDELKLLKKALKNCLDESKTVKVKRINQIANFLEIKSLPLPKILKSLGVNIKGKDKTKRSKIIV